MAEAVSVFLQASQRPRLGFTDFKFKAVVTWTNNDKQQLQPALAESHAARNKDRTEATLKLEVTYYNQEVQNTTLHRANPRETLNTKAPECNKVNPKTTTKVQILNSSAHYPVLTLQNETPPLGFRVFGFRV